MKHVIRLFPVLCLLLHAGRGLSYQSPEMSSSGILLELQKLGTLGSVLYVGAHPDDENTNLLAYLTKGRLVRAGYLSLTRGEGGQNLLGPEKGDALGVIRTEELLRAREVDGAEQYFSRAIDFGYSKNSGEAIRLWGGDEIVADIVRVIRTFRPDVIITRFSPDIGGHGQHTASAILTRRAYDLAADSTYRPGEFAGLPAWRARRLMFNGSSWMRGEIDTTKAIRINTGGYNPLLGLSYNEISGMSRSMHKSQGFGAAQTRGDVINYFYHTAGDSAVGDIFDGIDLTWSRVPGGAAVAAAVDSAIRAFDPGDPAAVVPPLLNVLEDIDALPPSVWTRVKRASVLALIQAAAGIWIDALVPDATAAPGDTISVRASVINRSALPVSINKVAIPFARVDSVIGEACPYNRLMVFSFTAPIPPGEPAGVPYWLERPSTGFRYQIADPSLTGLPVRPPRYTARVSLAVAGRKVSLDLPIGHTWVDPVEGELTRPFVVTPPVSVEPVEKVILYSGPAPKTLDVRVTAGRDRVSGTLSVETPSGWTVSPATIRFDLTAKARAMRATFTIAASADAAPGSYRVVATVAGTEVSSGTVTIHYPHIPDRAIFPAATGTLLPVDLRKKKFFIGYIAGSGDDVPEALRQMGYDVRLLTDEDLLSADLAGFQAIVAGVRAYNTRNALHEARQRLMEYVAAGGTYVVQYVTAGNAVTDSIGPYPFHISRDRVSEEDAVMTLLDTAHPSLAFPNRITAADFSGWVQERGLYFADRWDTAYVPVLACNDRGEPVRKGALLVARYGEGYFCYTGLSFFRQLPAGVAGAYRLFANLVELGSLEKISGGKEGQ